MKHQLLLGCALTFTSALASGEDTDAIHRVVNKGGKPKANMAFADRILPNHQTRDLRAIGQRRTKQGKVSSPDRNMYDDDDDMNYGDKSGKMSKSKGRKKGGGSKSGKSSKGDPKYTSHKYYMAPFQCTNMCIDADGADFRTGELDKAVESCDVREMRGRTQQWILHQENDLIQVESYAYRGECISVNYRPGDKAKAVQERCHDGTLALLPCDDPASHWYFDGGQLLSFFCWSWGVSSKMSVSRDADKGKKCHEELLSSSDTSGAMRRTMHDRDEAVASTFMFITSDDMHALYDPMTEVVTELPTLAPSYSPTRFPTMMPTSTHSPSITTYPTTTTRTPTYSPSPPP